MRFFLSSAFAAAALMLSGSFTAATAADTEQADSFPDREVMLVVTWAPGGRTDAATRIWAPYLAEEFGVPAVVENKPGAGGIIGARSLLNDKEGYSVGVLSTSHLISQWARIPAFELDKYQPVALLYSSPVVLTVNASSDIETLDDFIAAAKEKTFIFGHPGHGSGDHLSTAAFADMTGIEVQHVPYDGDAGAVTALLHGEIDAVMLPLVAITQQIDAGKLRPIAVSQLEADELHQHIPTFAEQGVEFADGDMAGAVFIAGDAPADVVQAWEDALKRTFENEALKEQLGKFYIVPDFKTGAELTQIIEEWNPPYEELVERLGLKATP